MTLRFDQSISNTK